MAHHETTTFTALVLTLLASFLAGCGNALPPGSAGLTVTALAEPKAGYAQPADLSGGYSGPAEGAADGPGAARNPFRLIDYRNLEDVVIHLEPEDESAAAAAAAAAVAPLRVTIDAGRADGPGRGELNVASVGGAVVVRNTGGQPAAVYLRSEAGAITDLGTVPPNGSAAAPLTAPGLLAVFRETGRSDDERLADVFVAPNGWARRTVSGGTVTFAPVPPGRYALTAWHPRLPGSRQSVTLAADRTTAAEARVGVNPLPKVPGG